MIMMSGHGTVETAVEATRLGAYDFLEAVVAGQAAADRRGTSAGSRPPGAGERRPQAAARTVIEPIGHSPMIQRLREQVNESPCMTAGADLRRTGQLDARFCPLPARAQLTQGPPLHRCRGVGHQQGQRGTELFGSERDGSIQYGRLEQAGRWHAFPDEVADMDLEAQAQLVGALDTVPSCAWAGGAGQHRRTRHRCDPARPAPRGGRGKFREDLFYQLNVVPLVVLPLREHREDIPELFESAVDRLVGQDKLPYRRFSISAQNLLRNHNWPGNIRELKNLV